MSRKAIPEAVVADLLIGARRRCCLCVYLGNDRSRKRIQIAHIDRNSANDDPQNLVPLCLDHHDEYDSRTSQSKGLTQSELRHYKEMWIAEVARSSLQEISYATQVRLPDISSSLFYEYGVLFSEVARILIRYDPVGINYCPDEYDPEVHDIISRLYDCGTSGSAALICRQVFEDWFSVVHGFTAWDQLGLEVDAVWERFRSRRSVFIDP